MTDQPTTTSREWPTPVVVSAGTGRLLCPFGDLHEFLDWMTGDTLMTHQLPRALDSVSPAINEQFPWMSGVEFPEPSEREDGEAFWRAFAQRLADEQGQTLNVEPLSSWEQRDPIAELVDMVGEDRVIPVVIPEASA